MTAAPSAIVRKAVFDRDQHRCMAADQTCFGILEWQHRECSGMGGHGSKRAAVTAEDGIILCSHHNADAEGAGQDRALRMGWKIRANRGDMKSSQIPYYDRSDAVWYLPVGVDRVSIREALAHELLEASGAFNRKLAVN